jgi:hypothetical protein
LDGIKDFRNPHEAKVTEQPSGRKPPGKPQSKMEGEKTGETVKANLTYPLALSFWLDLSASV